MRIARALAAGTVLLLAAASCTRAPAGGGTGPDVVVGADIELTGSGSVLGQVHKNSLQLVTDQINQAGGVSYGGQRHRLRVLIRDNRSDPALAKQIATDLVTREHVVALLGGGTSGVTLGFRDVAQDNRVPLISMASSDAIPKPLDRYTYVFKLPPDPQSVLVLLRNEFQQQKYHRVGLLAVDNPYGQSGVNGLQNGLANTEVQLVATQRFPEQDQDYTTQVRALMDANPEAIVVWSIFPDAGYAAQSIKKAGYQGKVYFDSGAGAELFLSGAGSAAEGMYMVVPTIIGGNQLTATTPQTLSQKAFFAAYSERYSTFSGFASYSADALNITVSAIEKAGSTEHRRVRDTIAGLQYDGLTGPFAFSARNHGGVDVAGLSVFVVHNGGWVLSR